MQISMNVKNRARPVMSIPDVKIEMDPMHVVSVQSPVNVSVRLIDSANENVGFFSFLLINRMWL